MKDLTFKQNLMTTIIVFAFLFTMISLNASAQDESTQYRRPNRPEEKWDMFHNMLIAYKYLFESEDGKRCEGNAYYSGYFGGGSSYHTDYHKTIEGKEYFRVCLIVYDFREGYWTDYSGEEGRKIYRYDEDKKENVLLGPYWFDYREEGEKLYRYNEEKKQDELFMDFGLNVGDVFDRPDGVKLQVVEVGDTLMDEYDGPLKVLCLEGVDDESVKDKWVECFGSIQTGLLLADDIPNYRVTDLLFIEKENGNYSHRGIYNEISNNHLVSARFNVQDLLNGDTTKGNVTYEEGDGWSLSLPFMKSYQYEYFFLYQEDNNTLKYRSTPCGNYLEIYSSQQETVNVNVNLNFPSGTYSLYNASGNFVKTITIGDDADAISAIENDASNSKKGNSLFFDLTGRPLSTAPQRGIYIQDGRKMLK